MTRYLLGVLWILGLQAQTLTLTSTGAVYPGAPVVVTATLGGSGSQNISGIGLSLPAGLGATSAIAPASTAAGKTLWSAGTTVLLIGFTQPAAAGVPNVISNTPYADGAVLTVNYTIPATAAVGSTVDLTPSNVQAASTSGASVPLSVTPFPVTVGTNPACITAITANLGKYLAAPSLTLLDQLLVELAAAGTSGSCQ